MYNVMEEKLKAVSKEMFKGYDADQDIKHIDNKMSKNIIISNNIENKINEIKNKEIVHSNIEKGVTVNKINYTRNKRIDLDNIQWGEVLYVNLDGGKWSEQNNDRFAICIQNQIGNKYSPTVIVAFVTSQLTKSKLPTHVPIPAGSFGLPKDSIVMLEQVRTLDKRRIISRAGMLDDETKKKIERAKNISMSDLQEKSPLEKLPIYAQNMINEKLEDIRSIERTICTIVDPDEYLKNNLYGQRECYLASLERICKKYNLDYHDYYTMYKREREEVRIVV